MRIAANVIPVLYLLFLPLLTMLLTDYEVMAWSVFLLAGGLCAWLSGRGGRSVSVTVADLFVLLSVLWACVSVIFLRHGKVDALYPYSWIAMLLLYGVCSRMNRAGVFGGYMALVLSGTVQAVWALLQKNGFYTDMTADFAVTGSFGNPGPLGGYLAVAFAAALGCLREVNNRAGKALLLTALLPISAALVVSDSRAAWLSALTAAVFTGWSILPDALRCRCRKWYVWFTVSAVVAGMLFGCYRYKKVSADVRLLIWTAGMEMVADAPWCGHGVGSFPMQYMDYQGEWLARHPGSRFHALADNNIQAFSEPLSLLCEQGVVGGVLAAVLVTMALSGTRFRHYSSVLLALGVFSCFSYPTDVFALKMLFPMLTGTLSCRRVLFAFTPDRRWMAVVCCMLLLCSGGAGRAVVQHYRDAFRHLTDGVAMEEVCPLPYHQRYMARYAKCLLERGEEEKYCQIADSGSFPFVTSVVYCDLGMAYHSCGNKQKAEEILLRAYRMVPPKILPRFCLFKLYRAWGCDGEAARMAEEILSLNVKRKGTVYLEARTAASLFLKERREGRP